MIEAVVAAVKEAAKITVEVGKEVAKKEAEILKKEIGGVNDAIKLPKEVRDIYRNCPNANGVWKGEKGDSRWVPKEDYIPLKSNPENKTWREIMKEYNIKWIDFIKGEPNFKKISKGEVKISGFSENRSDNFDKADIALAKQWKCNPSDVKKFRKENGYTWHECKDQKTMQCVPSIIHNNISHSGGISEAKKGI